MSLIHRNQTYSCPPTRVCLLLFRLVSLAFDQCLCYHSQRADLWGSRGLEGEPGFTHRCFIWMGPKLEWTRLFVCGTMACDSTVRHTGPQGTRADMKRRGSYREERDNGAGEGWTCVCVSLYIFCVYLYIFNTSGRKHNSLLLCIFLSIFNISERSDWYSWWKRAASLMNRCCHRLTTLTPLTLMSPRAGVCKHLYAANAQI